MYILWGHPEKDDDLPKVYVGQADDVMIRIDQHRKTKEFWHRAAIFVPTSGSLNRAHVTWLEYSLVKLANEASQSALENGVTPQEPKLTEAEKADTQAFLNEILQILPLINIRAFEKPDAIAVQHTVSDEPISINGEQNTIVVPAQKEGFEDVFLGENSWYAIGISGGKLNQIKYSAAYQTNPISAITHVAAVERIEPYGDGGKYKVIFSSDAKPIGPIEFGDAPLGTMQSTRYTTKKVTYGEAAK